jgi:branched-subunit amino acid aminotransferase/4-amino-4-deoxychorismate lyase
VHYNQKAAGFDEVLFLDGRSDRFVEEAGASNFFVVGCLQKFPSLSNFFSSSHSPFLSP